MIAKTLPIVCLITLLAGSFSTECQTEIFNPSHRWRLSGSCFDGSTPTYFGANVFISGDTLIDSTLYRIVVEEDYPVDEILGYVHQSGEQVHYLPHPFDPQQDSSVVLYDFSLVRGDTFRVTLSDTHYPDSLINHVFEVRGVDSVLLHDSTTWRKSISLWHLSPRITACFAMVGTTWYEGIGSDVGPIYHRLPIPDCWECAIGVDCFYRDSTELFGLCRSVSTGDVIEAPHIRLYPIPIEDRLFLEDPENQVENIIIRDLRGTVIHRSAGVSSVPFGTYSSGVYVVSMELRSGEQVVRKVLKQ